MAAAGDDSPSRLHFLDLPSEVRDMVYLYFRPYSWIDISQMPSRIHQPSVAFVSKQVRKECLDVFYGKNRYVSRLCVRPLADTDDARFMLDLRGWKNSGYPKKWTPNDIFERWITAIGDDNAARLRSLTFYEHAFAVNFTITNVAPRITAKLRQNRDSSPNDTMAEDAPAGYNFDTAIERARARLQFLIADLLQQHGDHPLTAQVIGRLLDIIEDFRPALCSRMGLGYKGATISACPQAEPEVSRHRHHCGECSYSRITGRALPPPWE